jgi:hypothetical protein
LDKEVHVKTVVLRIEMQVPQGVPMNEIKAHVASEISASVGQFHPDDWRANIPRSSVKVTTPRTPLVGSKKTC